MYHLQMLVVRGVVIRLHDLQLTTENVFLLMLKGTFSSGLIESAMFGANFNL